MKKNSIQCINSNLYQFMKMKIGYYHPFHLVSLSMWPFIQSVSLMMLLIGFIKFMNYDGEDLLILGLISMFSCMMLWWRDVIRESSFQGFHNSIVMSGIKMGMIMFIIFELFFFFSFFWAFFHMSLSPSMEIGMLWPPKGMDLFNPFLIPLLNTSILLSSGVTLTVSHFGLLKKHLNFMVSYLKYTIYLGMIFSMFQLYEYFNAMFTISDSVYGSLFFMLTGFHGLHVIIGTLFLLVMLFRMKLGHFSKIHHVGFEAASWYWHFVDVVWLFLFLIVYWWIYYLFSMKNMFNFQLKDLMNLK
uniref:Cytochrome c oxidase subunit 3 n=1 Tax=Chrysis pseudobrevitarsis TaxID=913302 RepID=A0A1D9CJF0_9HYME|nr:cytochrome c oxidase subunit 3 [Chrysis pseudobrevitarsis]